MSNENPIPVPLSTEDKADIVNKVIDALKPILLDALRELRKA